MMIMLIIACYAYNNSGHISDILVLFETNIANRLDSD